MTEDWNPSHDTHLHARFGPRLAGKRINKGHVGGGRRPYGGEVAGDRLVARLAEQKGIDFL